MENFIFCAVVLIISTKKSIIGACQVCWSNISYRKLTGRCTGCLIVFVIANVWKSDINQSRMNHFRVSFPTATNSDKIFTQPFEI